VLALHRPPLTSDEIYTSLRTTLVNMGPLVPYRSNDYSVPTEYGHRQVLVKGYVHKVAIVCGSDVIARDERTYERESAIFDPLHYLKLLEHKNRALEQAAPPTGWQLPDCFLHPPQAPGSAPPAPTDMEMMNEKPETGGLHGQ
jgi:hypothetical protein